MDILKIYLQQSLIVNEVLKRAIKIEANVTNNDRGKRLKTILKMILVMSLILMNMAVIMLLNFIHQQFQKLNKYSKSS